MLFRCMLYTSPAITCPDRKMRCRQPRLTSAEIQIEANSILFQSHQTKENQHIVATRIRVKPFFDIVILYSLVSAIVPCQTFCAEALRRSRSTASFAGFYFDTLIDLFCLLFILIDIYSRLSHPRYETFNSK